VEVAVVEGEGVDVSLKRNMTTTPFWSRKLMSLFTASLISRTLVVACDYFYRQGKLGKDWITQRRDRETQPYNARRF